MQQEHVQAVRILSSRYKKQVELVGLFFFFKLGKSAYFALLNVPALVLVVNVLARFVSLWAEELAE